MKKLLSCIIILTLLLPSATQAEKKEFVSALTFCELYTQRVLEMGDYLGISITNIGYEPFSEPYKENGENIIVAQCSSGILSIRVNDLKVIEWSDILMVVDDKSDSFSKRMTSCSAAISALEYDVTEGNIKRLSGYDPAMYVYINILNSKVSDWNILNKAFSVGNVLIYEGKYKYYLDGITLDGKKMIFITAK